MEISSKYNPKEVEGKILLQWLETGSFNAQVRSDKKPFSIVIPPPNITGILHMGHALNNTLQDVLIRYRRMQGYEALWMPGTDHAGIATQNVVEKDLAKQNLRKEDIGREEFTARLWAWTDKYGSTILEQLKKLGASCDWRRIRFTLDNEYNEAIKEAFVRLYEKGLIYRGNYIINWCPRCKTALSDEEAVRKEIDGWLYYIKYPVSDVERSTLNVQRYVVVATTRPETMLGDTAIAVHPQDERFAWLKNATVTLPIMERQLRVIEDEIIDMAFGTGVVKVTPSHDPVDFALGKKHNLDFINIMHQDATLNEHAGEFSGMDRFKAREAIVALLEEKKLIEKKEPYKIAAGHCYRCHTIIEPRVSLQWFVKMKPLAEAAITVVEEDKIRFYPARWKKVYLNWMYNIQDWCISRQIWWGHRLPVYYCKQCTTTLELKTQSAIVGEVKKGIVVSKEKPQRCPDCGSIDLVQDNDVLDTWFSSWLWPFATFYWPNFRGQKPEAGSQMDDKKELEYFYPTAVLITASEILFFWVARMIMAGLEFKKEIPFREVLIHGTVRDERGIKMSKSLGNIIDPLVIIDKFGTDALRFSLMLLAASGSDIYLSDEKFLVGRNFANKIWNATRFILLKIKESQVVLDTLDVEDPDVLDRWLLKELSGTIREVDISFDEYRINDATKKIYDFFWHTFCDWYIEMIKEDFNLRRAKMLLRVLVDSVKLLHPVMPFITEEVFGLIKRSCGAQLEPMLVCSRWPQTVIVAEDEPLAKLTMLIETVKELRNIKIDLGLAQKKVILEVKADSGIVAQWKMHETWIRRLAFLERIDYKEHIERTICKNDLWELNLAIEGADIKNFIASLDKKIKSLESVLEKVTQRLGNEHFLKNASEETVQQEQLKFQEVKRQLQRFKELKDAFK
ncbi:MAG: valine--tRNA ligase [Candidatus Omnitrophota bacterium]